MVTTEPKAEYERRLAARQETLTALASRERLISILRLVVVVLVIGVVLASLWNCMSRLWLVVPLTGFVALFLAHASVLGERDLARAAVSYYERALARVGRFWQGSGCSRDDFVGQDHPYASSLDLFGHGSLFELLCIASTREGEDRLASWLIVPALSSKEIRDRQKAIEELRPLLDLREDMAVVGGRVREDADSVALTNWATAAPLFGRSAVIVQIVVWVLTFSALAGVAAWIFAPYGPVPLFLVAIVQWAFRKLVKRRIEGSLACVDRRGHELSLFASVFATLESHVFVAPYLAAIQQRLGEHAINGAPSASKAIRRLGRLVDWLDWRRNLYFKPSASILLWEIHLGLAIERWRNNHGQHVTYWLDAMADFEALNSLAGYAFEHPADPFPKICEHPAVFHGVNLGHPLILDSRCVRNTVHLSRDTPVWIVSGSNMSGKSTLLRTVGVNVVLAQAGAPVRASSLTLSPCHLGATMNILDSIGAGVSRFYCEIQRFKQLRDLANRDKPLLFLLDEVLQGTNSHDRQVAAVALVQKFINAGAMGLVVTHDLAIADAASRFDGRVRNVHFTDHLEQGTLVFDYRLRHGVTTRSNALELMRATGLKV